ncbi:16S rRNA (cytosine(1402)-N(4))-methyltransferase RsmH [Roseibacillus persicicus]|uniref:16S rRNA (cytosine(1402)-N(4))-methyltransferase RsmH n=1 Tax=Roseibacillus persicicus TaxID=454148 RepID=UPI00280EFC91|nr:16S rRNA (cytosine(1402)-N(4))-methyltransferase RsmH [Roseibacillus persicicus]MDQ8188698.1 16S rRNA (cytosine(1402)-N(4))-methyltransferase RsmH [Roseibacillus persicicus]
MLTPAFIPALAGSTDCLAVLGRMVDSVVPGWRGHVFHNASSGEQVGGGNEQEFYHKPVLMDEVLAGLEPEEGKLILDGTLGGGGHSERLLEAGAHVVGMDRDGDALAYAGKRLEVFGDRFRAEQGNFSEMRSVVPARSVDGVLLDLGVSSWQLDQAGRGFSFQKDGPLDMRMDQAAGETAADWVNQRSAEDLANIFFQYGEEKASRRIAAAIVRAREEEEFTTTLQLASCVEKVMGGRGRKHPATRVFQALRMAVNTELDSVTAGLEAAEDVIKPGGILAVITFHSLEDRLVKQFLKKRSVKFLDRPEWPEPRPNPDLAWDLVSRKAIAATEGELAQNTRARSAKLRLAKRR